MRFLFEAEPTVRKYERQNPLPKFTKKETKNDSLTSKEEKAYSDFETNKRHKEIQALFDKETDSTRKHKLIQEWIETHPNYKHIKDAYNAIDLSILENDSMYESKNPFLSYINNKKINFDLHNDQANLIYTLLENGNLDLKQPWLYDNQLYKGQTNDSLYKLKAFAFASNKDLVDKYGDSEQLKIDNFYDESGKIKSVSEIKKILGEFQTKQPTNTKQGTTKNKVQKEMEAEENITNPNIQAAADSLKRFGLNNKEIGDALASVEILPEETAEDYVLRLFKSLGR